VKSNLDLSRIKIRLENISKKATKFVSFIPSELSSQIPDLSTSYSSTVCCLENSEETHEIKPECNELMKEWDIFAYDESVQDYRALEGDLLFCSSSTIKIENEYRFNLSVSPYFLTGMKKFKNSAGEDIRYSENTAEERNLILTNAKTGSILASVEHHSIILIDGPLLGGNVSSYVEKMDQELREKDCIPLYFVKNSDSKLVVATNKKLSNEFNSDFHWAACRLNSGSRSPFFRYTEELVSRHSKVFTYMKALYGFPERLEMHPKTYEKYYSLMPSLMSLLAYFYLVQGDRSNPQVRPIAIAEKYAREGIRILNIPVLLNRLGFRPTINQIRFG
jgi:hypothetical protein